MTHDPTEAIRRDLVAVINAAPGSREALEEEHGAVYDTTNLQRVFEVLAFAAPYVVVKRRDDGVKGTLLFQHSPRFYYAFSPDS